MTHSEAGVLSTVMKLAASNEPKKKAFQDFVPAWTAAEKKALAQPLRPSPYRSTAGGAASSENSAIRCQRAVAVAALAPERVHVRVRWPAVTAVMPRSRGRPSCDTGRSAAAWSRGQRRAAR